MFQPGEANLIHKLHEATAIVASKIKGVTPINRIVYCLSVPLISNFYRLWFADVYFVRPIRTPTHFPATKSIRLPIWSKFAQNRKFQSRDSDFGEPRWTKSLQGVMETLGRAIDNDEPAFRDTFSRPLDNLRSVIDKLNGLTGDGLCPRGISQWNVIGFEHHKHQSLHHKHNASAPSYSKQFMAVSQKFTWFLHVRPKEKKNCKPSKNFTSGCMRVSFLEANEPAL